MRREGRSARVRRMPKAKLDKLRVGRPPSDDTVRMQVRVPRELYDRIEAARTAEERSRDVWCKRAFEAALAKG
jgi:hypothetical protein